MSTAYEMCSCRVKGAYRYRYDVASPSSPSRPQRALVVSVDVNGMDSMDSTVDYANHLSSSRKTFLDELKWLA